MSERASGRWLIAASVLFWLAWALMPGVGVTDARQILERVALQRDAVWLSAALQLLSAACFAPPVVALGAIGHERGRPTLVWGAVLLAIGAMGSAADAIFHLLAYYMTAPGTDVAAMLPLMARMQGPGLALLAPLLLAFSAGAATLAIGCWRAGMVSGRNPCLHAVALAVALCAPLAVRVDPSLARVVGLIVLFLISTSLAGIGRALGPAMPLGRVVLVTVGILLLLALATFLAGERTEVVVLRTQDDAGKPFETKMWIVDHQGAPWVRVANAERHWYRRVLAHPSVELVRGGRPTSYVAHPEPSQDVRLAVDAAFAAKYGFTDAWYGALLRRDAIPVRLDPARN
jgi:hypothetical protein